jgi:hypothetical protein
MDVSLRSGARTLSRGLRTGNAGVAALGALVVAVAYLRMSRQPERTLIHAARVRPGQSLRVVVTRPDRQPTR